MWILSLIPFTGIRSVIHSHRGTGFLNQFSSCMWIHQELILIKGFVLLFTPIGELEPSSIPIGELHYLLYSWMCDHSVEFYVSNAYWIPNILCDCSGMNSYQDHSGLVNHIGSSSTQFDIGFFSPDCWCRCRGCGFNKYSFSSRNSSCYSLPSGVWIPWSIPIGELDPLIRSQHPLWLFWNEFLSRSFWTG